MDIDMKINKRIHPQKFALWLGMASMIMLFGAFTSAYLVKQAAGNWLEYQMPNLFYISTLIIVASSITLHFSFKGYINGQESQYKGLLLLSFILGIAFLVMQYLGWNELYNIGVDLKANVAGSFFYLISGVHALHILGVIAALFVAIFHAFTLRFRYSDKRKHRFELVCQYWHFVDILWIYLFVFLLTSK
jgi:cytochrome c oxidase subunit 3